MYNSARDRGPTREGQDVERFHHILRERGFAPDFGTKIQFGSRHGITTRQLDFGNLVITDLEKEEVQKEFDKGY